MHFLSNVFCQAHRISSWRFKQKLNANSHLTQELHKAFHHSDVPYALHPQDCSATHSSNSILIFADDIVVLGLVSNDDTANKEEVENLA